MLRGNRAHYKFYSSKFLEISKKHQKMLVSTAYEKIIVHLLFLQWAYQYKELKQIQKPQWTFVLNPLPSKCAAEAMLTSSNSFREAIYRQCFDNSRRSWTYAKIIYWLSLLLRFQLAIGFSFTAIDCAPHCADKSYPVAFYRLQLAFQRLQLDF